MTLGVVTLRFLILNFAALFCASAALGAQIQQQDTSDVSQIMAFIGYADDLQSYKQSPEYAEELSRYLDQWNEEAFLEALKAMGEDLDHIEFQEYNLCGLPPETVYLAGFIGAYVVLQSTALNAGAAKLLSLVPQPFKPLLLLVVSLSSAAGGMALLEALACIS